MGTATTATSRFSENLTEQLYQLANLVQCASQDLMTAYNSDIDTPGGTYRYSGPEIYRNATILRLVSESMNDLGNLLSKA